MRPRQEARCGHVSGRPSQTGLCKRCYDIERRDRLREQAYAVLGDCCSWCGDRTRVVLEIDHIYGDGHKDRARGFRGGSALYVRVLSEPERFQLLCANDHKWKSVDDRLRRADR